MWDRKKYPLEKMYVPIFLISKSEQVFCNTYIIGNISEYFCNINENKLPKDIQEWRKIREEIVKISFSEIKYVFECRQRLGESKEK